MKNVILILTVAVHLSQKLAAAPTLNYSLYTTV